MGCRSHGLLVGQETNIKQGTWKVDLRPWDLRPEVFLSWGQSHTTGVYRSYHGSWVPFESGNNNLLPYLSGQPGYPLCSVYATENATENESIILSSEDGGEQ